MKTKPTHKLFAVYLKNMRLIYYIKTLGFIFLHATFGTGISFYFEILDKLILGRLDNNNKF
jgi:hypothetical protein